MTINRRVLLIPVLLLSIGVSIHAEEQVERLLVPLFFVYPLPGAYDTLWVTELTVTNPSAEPIRAESLVTACRVPACPAVVPAGATLFATPYLNDPLAGGRLVPISEKAADTLVWNLQVRETSRSHLQWAVEVPVVHEREGKSLLNLINLPVHPGYRVQLRLYDFDQADLRHLTLRYYEIDPSRRGTGGSSGDRLLSEEGVAISWNGDELAPGQLTVHVPVAEFENVKRLRVEVEAESCETCLWGMASITHNDTQQVSIVTPDN